MRRLQITAASGISGCSGLLYPGESLNFKHPSHMRPNNFDSEFPWKNYIWNVQTSCLLAECMACDFHSCLSLTAKKSVCVCVCVFILIRTHLDITIMIIVRIPSFVTLPQFHALPCFVFSRKVPWTQWAMPQLSRHLLFALPDHESNSIPRVSQRACVP